MSKVKNVNDYFSKGYNCTQALLASFGEDFGIGPETGIRLGSGLGAGMGYQGKICGAVLGAYIIFSLKYGSLEPNDELSQEYIYHLSREFDRKFKEKHNSLICNELLKTDLSTPHGFALAEEEGLFADRCTNFLDDAASIIENLINTK